MRANLNKRGTHFGTRFEATYPSTLTNLGPIHARGSRGIVPIAAPSRMIEVKHKIAVVGNDRVIEPQSADGSPIAETAPLQKRRASRRTLIGHFDTESQ